MMTMSKSLKKNLKIYLISCVISIGIGVLAALITKDNMDLYTTIRKPPLAPPGWLFAIVWTLLYLLMGIGAARVWLDRRAAPQLRSDALTLYALNLAVNFLWSIFFFNYRAFLFSFVWLLLLFGIVFVMILKFRKIDGTAAALQLPYLVWIAFAGYLNLAVTLLNR